MTLALRLNELTAAYEHGLVNDDDYRILKQSLFEQYASDPSPKQSSHSVRQQQQPQSPPPQPNTLRRKQSVVNSFANLFRRAAGRSSKKQTPEPSVIEPPPTSKRIPRKPSFITLLKPDTSQQPQPADHEDLNAIRSAIAETETEHNRLLSAFNTLEASTIKRIEYRTARRLYTPTPKSVDVLLQGKEWRKHTKPVPSIVLPPPTNNRRHHPISLSTSSSATGTTNSDRLSTHSAASSKTSLSLSRSVSSLPRQPNPIPSSPRHRQTSLQRQSSFSSASINNSGRGNRLALSQRSVGNLTRLSENISTDTIADYSRLHDDIDDFDNDDPEAHDHEAALRELADIQRRREELDYRYKSKLEYLKARLKAAELHERVFRR